MMGVYGRRCLGLVKDGCKGNVRLEVSVKPSQGLQRGLDADDQYTDLQLHNQLLFYRHLFDADKAVSQLRGSARFGMSTCLSISELVCDG